MTYRELDYKATRLLDNSKITLGEYEEMTKPLDREVEQEPTTKNDNQVLEDIKNEILEQYWGDGRKEYFDDKYSIEYIDGALEAADYIIKMIDKHKAGRV